MVKGRQTNYANLLACENYVSLLKSCEALCKVMIQILIAGSYIVQQ